MWSFGGVEGLLGKYQLPVLYQGKEGVVSNKVHKRLRIQVA